MDNPAVLVILLALCSTLVLLAAPGSAPYLAAVWLAIAAVIRALRRGK